MKVEQNVREPNKETLSPEYLDYLLYLALKSSKEEPQENRSIVVAGIYDPSTGKYFIASSRNVSDDAGYGKWNHAEYEAIALAQKNGVDLSKTIVITSLGPCLKDGNSRAHRSCTEIIIESGIKNVHIGILDERQADTAQYQKMGLTTTISSDPILTEVCAGLNNYFNPNQEKRLLGLDKAAYIDEILKDLPEDWNLSL